MSINSLIGALTPQGSGLNQLLDTINQAAGGGKGNPDLNSLLGLSLGVGGAAINLGPSPSNVSNFNANFGIDNLFSSTAGLGSMPSFVSSIFNSTPNFTAPAPAADPMANIFSGALGMGGGFGSTNNFGINNFGIGGSSTVDNFFSGMPSLLSGVFNNAPDFSNSFNTPLFGNAAFGNPGFGNSGFNNTLFNNFNIFGGGGFGGSQFGGGFGGGFGSNQFSGFGMPPILSSIMGGGFARF